MRSRSPSRAVAHKRLLIHRRPEPRIKLAQAGRVGRRRPDPSIEQHSRELRVFAEMLTELVPLGRGKTPIGAPGVKPMRVRRAFKELAIFLTEAPALEPVDVLVMPLAEARARG